MTQDELVSPEISTRVMALLDMANALAAKGDLESAKTQLNRAWTISGYAPELLDIYVKVLASAGDFVLVKAAYKQVGIRFAREGNVSAAIALFNQWQFVYPYMLHEDRYEYDLDVLSAVRQMAQPHVFTSTTSSFSKNEKLKVAYVMYGIMQFNSVIVKIAKLFARFHDKSRIEARFFVPESESSVMTSPQGAESVAYIRTQGWNVSIAPACQSDEEGLLDLASKIYAFAPHLLVLDAALADFKQYYLRSLRPAPATLCFVSGPPAQFVPPDVDWGIAWTLHPLIDSPVGCSHVPLEMELSDVSGNLPLTHDELGLKKDATILAAGGRHVKFQDIRFWRLVEQALKERADIEFIAVGVAEEQLSLILPMLAAEVRSRVKFFSWREDYLRIMGVADIVLDTYPSGGGVILQEVMSLGIPVLAFANDYSKPFNQIDWSPAQEFMPSCELVIPRGDNKRYLEVLDRLIVDAEYRARMGGECKDYVLANLGNPTRMVERCENIYIDVVKRKLADGKVNVSDSSIKFSVLVPTYNQALFLPQALDSLLSQSYSNWEAVVVNDGSTDNTADVLEQYASNDQRIRVFHKENGGAASALNEALKHVTGDWVLWLSSDDLFEPDKMAVHAEMARLYPDVRFFYTHHYLLDESKGIKYVAPFNVEQTIPPNELQVLGLFQLNYINGISVAIHKSVFDLVDGFDETMGAGQDFDLWLRISSRFPSYFINRQLSTTRIHSGQDTAQSVMRGIYDSGISCLRFINTHTFSDIFPLLDLTNDEAAVRAIEQTIKLLLNPNAYINVIGIGPVLAERLLEWLSNLQAERRDRLYIVVNHLALEVLKHDLPGELGETFRLLVQPAIPNLQFQLGDETQLLNVQLVRLLERGETERAKTLRIYLDKQFRSRVSSIPEASRGAKVLLVAHNFPPHNYGGVELYVYRMAQSLQKQGVHVSVLYPTVSLLPGKENGFQLTRSVFDGIDVHRLLVNLPLQDLRQQISFPAMTQVFERFLVQSGFDVVHFHHLMNWPFDIVAIAKRHVSRVVVTLHDFWPLCTRIHLFIKEAQVTCNGPESGNKCAKCVQPLVGFPDEQQTLMSSWFSSRLLAACKAIEAADDITVPSNYMREVYGQYGFPVKRILVSPLGVAEVHPVLHSPVEQVRFGYMGSIHPLKNVPLLIEAFKRLKGQARLLVFGSGAPNDVSQLRQQIAGNDRIEYMGGYKPEQLEDVLSQIDVLVVPSRVESYCFTAREALIAKIPVIAANVGGLKDAVANGVNGWLIEPEMGSLLQSMQDVVDNPDILHELDTTKLSFPTCAEDAALWAGHYQSFAKKTVAPGSETMVSVIICSIDDQKFSAVSDNYAERLRGVSHEIIRIPDAKSLCEGYNRAICLAKGQIVIFSHDDIKILSPDFWTKLYAHLNEFDIVGVAGTSLLMGSLWGDPGPPFIHGAVIQRLQDGKFSLDVFGTDRMRCVPNIQALDGLFFALKRTVLDVVRFDEKTFDGFHFYDLDFTYAAYRAGFKLGVSNEICIVHDSLGGFDEVWEYYAYLFLSKYKNVLPAVRPRMSGFFPAKSFWQDEKSALRCYQALVGDAPANESLELVTSAADTGWRYPKQFRDYLVWQEKTALSEVDAEVLAERMMRRWQNRPVFHLMVWVMPGEEQLLAGMHDSLASQYYKQWRLTVVSTVPAADSLWDESPQLHWQVCAPDHWFEMLNQLVLEVNADWTAFFPPGVKLEPHALLSVADYVNAKPDWHLIYSDDDRIGPDGSHFDPQFKPDFNTDLLRAIPYMGESVFVRTDFFLKLGAFGNYPGWENYHLSLAASCALQDSQVGHIAQVLMHYPYKRTLWPQASDVGLRALGDVLKKQNIPATVDRGLGRNTFRVNYDYPGMPLVSILIPTRDKLEFLRPCVESVLAKTSYPNYEILIADNQSQEPETLAWFAEIQNHSDGRVKVLPYDADFNFSAISNFLVEQSRGEYVLLLNNDTLVLQESWLDRMVSIGKRPNVGVVGCRLVYPDSGKIQHAGIVLGFNDVAGHLFEGIGNIKYAGYMQRALCEQNYSAVTAAVMLVRRSVYSSVGGMDAVDLSVLYNDVDLCLKIGEQGYKIVYTPYATLMHHAGKSLNDVHTLQDAQKVGLALERKERERRVFWRRWRERIAHDPAWNVNLSLRGAEGTVEPSLAPGWDINFHDRSRVLGIPLSGGAGEYRVISPLRTLRTAGRMQVAWATSSKMFQTRVIKEYELARLAPDTILMHAPLDDEQIVSLKSFKEYVPEVLRVATFDDLLTHVPEKNSFKKFGFKDVERRLREVVRQVDRCIVTTEPLRKCLLSFGAQDVRVLPNCLEMAKWGNVKSSRGKGQRPRVGWAGAQQHLGDLELIAEVVRTLAQEVEWVFFGMCPDELRPYVHEFHEFERNFDQYPAKLASLNLDLALAPLEIHPFNEAKSNLRLLEYGIMGWPVICTDIYPYQNAPVKRVENKTEAWVEAILERVRDIEGAKKEGDSLREWVLKNHVMEDHLDEWLAALVR